MTNELNDFLKTSDLYLTLINEHGERYEAGKAEYIKQLNSKAVLKWSVDGKYSNVFPFTYAVLHGIKEIFAVNFIKPIQPDRETTLEMVYR